MNSPSRLPFEHSRFKGVRLHKVELQNWGTFDGHVFTVRPNGQTTLLIGHNGSGKSTLVDALLTLLVRPGIRNFNVAAGAKKRERSERSYLLGAFDKGSDDAGTGIREKYLRPLGEQPTVILATFCNEDLQKTFTVAQILYVTSSQDVEKIYCYSEDERSIQRDFGQLGASDEMLKRLRDRGLRATRTFQEFDGWFSKATKTRPKAMEVFNQTVAVKDIQKLNDFIRDHMLEPHDWGEKVDRLLGHFAQLSEAHDSLIRVRQQRDLLEPVSQLGQEYRQETEKLHRVESMLQASSAYFSQRTIDLLTPIVERKQQELAELGQRKESLASEIQLVRERQRSLQNEIDHVGGGRLKLIPSLIQTEEAHVEGKRKSLERMREALRLLSRETPADDQSFSVLQSQMPTLKTELDSEVSRLGREQEQRVLERAQIRQQMAALKTELEGLSQRRENIPEWCVQLRQSICQELGFPPRDLPFAAELMQVQGSCRDWEATVEKVLHGLGLSLLVPDKFYHLVASHVDRTRLTAQGRGQRLVYLRVAEQVSQRGRTHGGRLLIDLLDFRPGHALLPWLKAELNDRFDYTCCETIEDFQASHGLAMTRKLHVKSGRQRHEKDDRDQAHNPRNFILGWDNREKKQRLAVELQQRTQAEAALSQQLSLIATQLSQIQTRIAAISEVQRFSRFSDIDIHIHQREIERLIEERRAIEQKSDALRLLKQRLEQARIEESALQTHSENLIGDEREIQIQIAQSNKLLTNAQTELRKRASEGSLDQHRVLFPELDAEFVKHPLTADNLWDRREAFRTEQDKSIQRLKQRVEPIRNSLTNAMSKFLGKCPEEAADLRASVDYLDGFLGFRQRIIEDDLPRHEQRFKERLNQKVIEEIGLFRSSLEQEKRKIEEKIELLNASLKKLEYRPGHHIQLEPRSIKDPEITDFQGRLRSCVEGSFEDSVEANEARFVKIKELIVRLKDDESKTWREKVTDVRRWFDFVATVIDRETEKSVSVYQDSSGQSGGEKAKLAFTILVAAIAYQYELDPENPVSDRFHFVMVDEMFSKIDPLNAEYALNLFQQFGLQLLIVSPLDPNARVTQPYAGYYLHVVKKENRSTIYEMNAEEFHELAQTGDARMSEIATDES